MIDTLKILVPLFSGVAAGAGVAWKVFTWRHERRAHIKVEANAGMLAYGPTLGDVQVIVTAVNEDPRLVVVSNVWLDHPDKPGEARAFIPQPPPGATLPGPLAPRGSGQTFFDIGVLEKQGFPIKDRPVIAAVETPAGEVFRSKPKVIYTS